MLFTAHVDVATLHQQIQGQSGENNESNNQFPHDDLLKKRPSTKGEGLG